MELASANTTMQTERRDFVEWHRGRSPYVFWALDVDVPQLRAELVRAAECLGGLLLGDYQRQPHVTLDLCGFPRRVSTHEDEFDQAFLDAQIARLRTVNLPSFEIEIGGLESFISAPYLALRDPSSALTAIRACLADTSSNRLQGHYVPHATVGLYAAAWPTAEVLARLRAFGASGMIRLRVERISLMSYAPAEIAGSLQILGDYWLNTGRMAWRREPPLIFSE